MSRCARCDFRTDPDGEGSEREQLTAHADNAAHPLCSVCTRSLTPHEPACCEGCLTGAASLLSGIVTLWTELPQHLGHLHGSLSPQGGRSSDGRPLPGNTVLVLMAGGSEGAAEDGTTTKDGDPPSIAFELTWWAEHWASLRDDFIKFGHSPARMIARAAGYLEVHNRWAATTHPGFAQYHADLTRLHRILERATHRDIPVDDTGTRCLDCRGDLMRLYDPRTGLANEHVTCSRCRREYEPAAYNLALRATVESNRGWVGQAEAARLLDVWPATVRQWATRGLVKTRRQGGRREVWWPDVKERAKGSAA